METSERVIECPVCATRIHGVAEVCVRCQTPHHQDCAGFLGRCATFGCGAFQFATADSASMGVEQVSLDAGSEPGSPALPAASTGLRRGIWSRIKAAARLLMANPSIVVPLLIAMVVVDCSLGGILAGPAKLIVQSLLVILFVARAKGKESSLDSAFGLIWQRGWRIVWSLFKVSFITTGLGVTGALLIGFGGVMSADGGAMLLLGAAICLAGLCMVVLSVRKFFSYALVAVIAALGKEEEPGSPLARSEELFAVDVKQLMYAPVALLFVGLPLFLLISGAAPLINVPEASNPLLSLNPLDWLSVLVVDGLTLVWTMYLVLFYLEARKILQSSSLPYTSEEFIPSRDEG